MKGPGLDGGISGKFRKVLLTLTIDKKTPKAGRKDSQPPPSGKGQKGSTTTASAIAGKKGGKK